MALKEYRLNGGTHLFDTDHVPEGAELVGDVAESTSPGTFDELVMAAHDARGRKGRRKAVANKAAPAPETKEDPEDEQSEETTEETTEEVTSETADETESTPAGTDTGDSAAE